MSFLKNSKIGTTLNVLVIISSMACIILSILGVWGLKKGEYASSTMYEDSLLPIQWIGSIKSNFYLINMNVKEIMLSKDEKRMKELMTEIDRSRTDTDELLKKFETRVSSNKEKELYTTFHKLFKELRTQLKKVQVLGQSNEEEAYAYYLKEADPIMKKAVQAIEQLKKEKSIPGRMRLRQQKYLNNIVEQDHRFIKKRIRSMLGFKCFDTATSILSGVEAMHMIKKEQVDLRDQSAQNQKEFIHQLFGLTA
ncbi:Protein of unknown function [Bacillus cereus]|nr:Protein of unknown function [Bacillus cereus]